VKETVRYYMKLFGSSGKSIRNGHMASGLAKSEIKYHE